MYRHVWDYGSLNFEPFMMSAGEEIEILLEWNFTSEAHANDWSLVAYGDKSGDTLSLTHFKG